MFDGIFFGIGTFLMLTGFISLLFVFMLKLTRPKRREKYFVIIRLCEDNDPSGVISSALEKRNLLGETDFCRIIAVNCSLSQSSLDFLVNMYAGVPMFCIVKPSEIGAVLDSENIR